MKKSQVIVLLSFLTFFYSCNENHKTKIKLSTQDSLKIGSFAYDADFLKKHSKNVVQLENVTGNAKILLSGDFQGRVMTSTATGDSGISYGWMNYELIASGQKKKQFNPYGGEERFWIGPEGGQYSIYFKTGDSFNLNHWQVPPVIDTVNYELAYVSKSEADFVKTAQLANYSGTVFDIKIERRIKLLDERQLEEKLQISIPKGVHFVGYETHNSIQNIGNANWSKQNGLLSVWLLGMFTPSVQTVVIIPFYPKQDARSYITDNYFGKIPTERLHVKDSILYFTCDGKYRSKIGLSPEIAKPIASSFDFEKNILTIVIPFVEKSAPYVNSKWEIQKEPYKGDVVNSYNDGPLNDGSQMGPFYEIESSSPALELKKGETGEYRQTTCHFQGDYIFLKQLAKKLLGVELDELKK